LSFRILSSKSLIAQGYVVLGLWLGVESPRRLRRYHKAMLVKRQQNELALGVELTDFGI
jgi:hypothetical protein